MVAEAKVSTTVASQCRLMCLAVLGRHMDIFSVFFKKKAKVGKFGFVYILMISVGSDTAKAFLLSTCPNCQHFTNKEKI